MANKIKICVLFGGNSEEHEVSCKSAMNVINYLDKDKYDIIPVGITKQGQWRVFDGSPIHIGSGEWSKLDLNGAALLPTPYQDGNLLIVSKNGEKHITKIDVVFPVLHGKNGEDGTIQGLLELSGVPYVGCGVLSSSVCMDKAYTKIVLAHAGIPQAKWITVTKEEFSSAPDSVIARVESELGYPCFIKPSNSGSSVGINKAHNKEEFIKFFNIAKILDRKVVIEEFIDGQEVECAVLGNFSSAASTVGEIVPLAEFYDYAAKYNDASTKLYIPANLSDEIIEKIKVLATKAFFAVDGTGLSRIDFFVKRDTNEIILNEINTLPGFTDISMYPKLWEHSGVSYSSLLDKLIALAFEKQNI